MVISDRNRKDTIGNDPFRCKSIVVSAVTKLAISVLPHCPKAAVAVDKKTGIATCCHSNNVRRHNLLGSVDLGCCAVAELAFPIHAHTPQATIGLYE